MVNGCNANDADTRVGMVDGLSKVRKEEEKGRMCRVVG